MCNGSTRRPNTHMVSRRSCWATLVLRKCTKLLSQSVASGLVPRLPDQAGKQASSLRECTSKPQMCGFPQALKKDQDHFLAGKACGNYPNTHILLYRCTSYKSTDSNSIHSLAFSLSWSLNRSLTHLDRCNAQAVASPLMEELAFGYVHISKQPTSWHLRELQRTAPL